MDEDVQSGLPPVARKGRLEEGKKRPAILLGGGTFDWPDKRMARAVGRNRFLSAVQSVKPDVLASLAGLPLERYRATAYYAAELQHLRDAAQNYPGRNVQDASDNRDVLPSLAYTDLPPRPSLIGIAWLIHQIEQGSDSWPTDSLPLRDALDLWAAEWNLTEPWCVAHALRAVHSYALSPSAEEFTIADAWALSSRRIESPLTGSMLTLSFDCTIYDPFFAPLSDGLKYLDEAYKQARKAFVARVEAEANAHGAHKTDEKREDEHFTWLVYRIVDKLSFRRIATMVGRTPVTVSETVRPLSQLLFPSQSSSSQDR